MTYNNNHSVSSATKNNHHGVSHSTPWKTTNFGPTSSSIGPSQAGPVQWFEGNNSNTWQTNRSFYPATQSFQGPAWNPSMTQQAVPAWSWDGQNPWGAEASWSVSHAPVWNQTHPWNSNSMFTEGANRPTWFAPPTSIAESSKVFFVTCELPGVNEKDIDVIWHQGTLVIRGQKREFKFDNDCAVFATDQVWGHFYRAIHMSHVAGCIDSQKIATKWSNGILEIILPKVGESTESYIKVGHKK